MNNRFLINYTPGSTPIHRLNGTTKVLGLMVLIASILSTFDVRFLGGIFLFLFICIATMKPNWKPIRFLFLLQFLFSGLLGSILIIVIAPDVGVEMCGQETIFWRSSITNLYLSYEALWYVFALYFKRLTSLAASVLFILSITPSELAAGLNSLGVPYKICTIVSLAFRTIPDIGRNYTDIKNAMEMRGMNYARGGIFRRLKQYSSLLVPLIVSSFSRVENIANSMDLRSYGKNKHRTWYALNPPESGDFVASAFLLILFFATVFYIIYIRVIHAPIANFWCPWVDLAVNGYLF